MQGKITWRSRLLPWQDRCR